METKIPDRIVLCGVSRSGKSSLANLLQQDFGHVPMSFASRLKAATKVIFGFSDEDLYGSSSKRETPYNFLFSGQCPSCRTKCEDPLRFLQGDGSVPEDVKDGFLALFESRPDFWRCHSCREVYGKYITPRLACRTLGTEWGRSLCTDLWARIEFAEAALKPKVVFTDGRFRNEISLANELGYTTVLLLRGVEESTSSHESEYYVGNLGRAALRDLSNVKGVVDIVLDNREEDLTLNYGRLISALADFHGTK